MTTSFFLSLDDPGCADSTVGGKAATLSQARRLGFRVPSGVAVHTQLFSRQALAYARTCHDLESLARRLSQHEFSGATRRALEEELHQLSPGPWAVRSSAVDEDQGAWSFAGIHQTILNVDTADVADAIGQVWAGLYHPHAIAYRARMSLLALPSSMGVLIQPMVTHRLHGVLFTRDGADREVIVISASLPGGTSVVDGGKCDTFWVEKESGYVRKQVDQLGSNTLVGEELRTMAELARRLEGAFGVGLDVEWCWVADDPEPTILQIRPITGQETGSPSVWTNANVGEALPGVATPLTWSIIHRFSQRGFEEAFGALGLSLPQGKELVGSFSGRIYLNLSEFLQIAGQVPFFDVDELFELSGGTGKNLVEDTWSSRSTAGFWKRLPLSIPRMVRRQVGVALGTRWQDGFFEQRDAFYRQDLREADLVEVHEDLHRIFDETGLRLLTASSNFLMSYTLLHRCWQRYGRSGYEGRGRELLSGLDVESGLPGLELWELGAHASERVIEILQRTPVEDVMDTLEQASTYPDVARFVGQLRTFLDRWGSRATREAELSTPRWREDPGFLFQTLKAYTSPDTRVARRRSDRRDDVDSLVEEAFPGRGRVFFSLLLKNTRVQAQMRESLRARVVDVLGMFRDFFLECGRRMEAQGILLSAESVFYLDEEEIEGFLRGAPAEDLHLRVLLRRNVYEVFTSMPDPPRTFVWDGKRIQESEDVPNQTFEDGQEVVTRYEGIAASPGRVTGRARVLRAPQQAGSVQYGEVLVIPWADVGWTPLFLSASALVVATGGPLSHAAIVAREYGIPTVVQVDGVMEAVVDGDLLTVDGHHGAVYHRKPAESQ